MVLWLRSALALARLAGTAEPDSKSWQRVDIRREHETHLAPQLQELEPQLLFWETGAWVVCEAGRQYFSHWRDERKGAEERTVNIVIE